MSQLTLEQVDHDAMAAVVDLLVVVGEPRSFAYGHEDHDEPGAHAHMAGGGWWCRALVDGGLVTLAEKGSLREVSDMLARFILTRAGSECSWCGRRVAVNTTLDRDRCTWRREGQRWRPTCERSAGGEAR